MSETDELSVKDEADWTSKEFLVEAEKELYEALEGIQSGDLIHANQSARRAISYLQEGWRKRGGKPKVKKECG
jgi:hypothetical protein